MAVRVVPGLQQVHAVVLAYSWRSLVVQGVEDADGVGLVGELGDVGLAGPAEGSCLVAGAEVSLCTPARWTATQTA